MKRFLPGLLLLLSLATALVAARPTLSVEPTGSSVSVDVRATGDAFTATLTGFTAAIELDDTNTAPATATVSFRVADLKTGNDKRDRKMNARFESDRFPEGRFQLRQLTREGSSDRYRAAGVLTLHGQEKAVEFPVTIVPSATAWSLDGEAMLDTRDFGLPIIRMFGLLTVDPQVKVRFHLQAKPSAS
jgi:polyisoprenoid-binding protein YceI